MSFEEAYEKYLTYASNRHKKQGFDTIVKNFKLHILPYFKDKKLNSITKLDIIEWENNILKLNFSNNFNKNLYYEFSAFYRYCIYCDFVSDNVVLQVPKFKKKIENKKHNVYNLSEFLKFRFYLDNYIIKQFFTFMYFYGTRPSEAMALRFSDLNKNIISINHNIQRKGNRELDTPKNQSSIRSFKINFLTLIQFNILKNMYLKKYGSSFDYFIFGGLKPLSPTTIDRYKLKACKKANLKPITQHEFRHSYATRMIHNKVPIDIVSKSMGHSTVSMTVDVYLH